MKVVRFRVYIVMVKMLEGKAGDHGYHPQVLVTWLFSTVFGKHSMGHVLLACVYLASILEEISSRYRMSTGFIAFNIWQRKNKIKTVPLSLDQHYFNLKKTNYKGRELNSHRADLCIHVKPIREKMFMYLQLWWSISSTCPHFMCGLWGLSG